MKLFTEVFDAIEKVFIAIKKIANLPGETRDELRNTFDETFKLLDTSLNMVIIRLGEILRISDEPTFATEVSQLSFDAGWTQAEREFRLCSGLRHVVSETGRLRTKILNYMSVQDWDDMQMQIQTVFLGEAQLGDFIASKFQAFSNTNIGFDKSIQQVRDELKQLQNALNTERRRLIKMEMDLYDNF